MVKNVPALSLGLFVRGDELVRVPVESHVAVQSKIVINLLNLYKKTKQIPRARSFVHEKRRRVEGDDWVRENADGQVHVGDAVGLQVRSLPLGVLTDLHACVSACVYMWVQCVCTCVECACVRVCTVRVYVCVQFVRACVHCACVRVQ